MPQYKFKNLATAKVELQSKITQKMKQLPKSKTQVDFLQHVLAELNQIETTTEQWFGSDLTKASVYTEKLPHSNADALQEIIKVRKPMEHYVTKAVGSITKEIKLALQSSTSKNFNHTLEKVLEDISAVPNHFATNAWCVINKQIYFYHIYDFARILGATIKPYNQLIDPLHGKSDGYCGGLAIETAHLIEQGKNSANIHVNQSVCDHQVNQPVNDKEVYLNLQNFTQFKILLKTLRTLSPERSYYLRFSNHVIMVRSVPGTSFIEIFEPNFGHFIFPDYFKAAEWLQVLFKLEFYQKNLCMLGIVKGPLQPANATSSIPVNTFALNTLPFIQTYIQQNLNCNNASELWMQKALIKAFENKLEGNALAEKLCQRNLEMELNILNDRAERLLSAINQHPTNAKKLTAKDDTIRQRMLGKIQVEIAQSPRPEVFAGLISQLSALPDHIQLLIGIQNWLSQTNEQTNRLNAETLNSDEYASLFALTIHEISHYQIAIQAIELVKNLTTVLRSVTVENNKYQIENSPFINKLIEIVADAYDGGMSVIWLVKEISKYCNKTDTNGMLDDSIRIYFGGLRASNSNACATVNKNLTELINEDTYAHYLRDTLEAVGQKFKKIFPASASVKFTSFSQLYDEIHVRNLNHEMSLKDILELYIRFPGSFLVNKSKSYTTDYLTIVKNIATPDFCRKIGGFQFFNATISPLYNAIQSATSINDLAAELKTKYMKTYFSPSSPLRTLCQLIKYLSRYGAPDNARGYCLLESFAKRYGIQDIELDQSLQNNKNAGMKI